MVTRESYWGANGAHSQGQWIQIKDLEDTHLNNIIKMFWGNITGFIRTKILKKEDIKDPAETKDEE